MNSKLKYMIPYEKYTVDEFLIIFKERQAKLLTNIEKITVHEAKERFHQLFDDCPTSLLINTFGIENALKKYFNDWNDICNNIFLIDTTNLSERQNYDSK